MMIIERIGELLSKDKRTQKDLCEYAGIKTSTLNNWLNRKTEPPSNYIIPICEFFEVSCEFLLTGENKKERTSISFEDASWLNLIHLLPEDVKAKFKNELEGYLKYSSSENTEQRQAK